MSVSQEREFDGISDKILLLKLINEQKFYTLEDLERFAFVMKLKLRQWIRENYEWAEIFTYQFYYTEEGELRYYHSPILHEDIRSLMLANLIKLDLITKRDQRKPFIVTESGKSFLASGGHTTEPIQEIWTKIIEEVIQIEDLNKFVINHNAMQSPDIYSDGI